MKNFFEIIFKKNPTVAGINAQPMYVYPPSFANAADDAEHEFEAVLTNDESAQDEMQIDNIYRCL